MIRVQGLFSQCDPDPGPHVSAPSVHSGPQQPAQVLPHGIRRRMADARGAGGKTPGRFPGRLCMRATNNRRAEWVIDLNNTKTLTGARRHYDKIAGRGHGLCAGLVPAEGAAKSGAAYLSLGDDLSAEYLRVFEAKVRGVSAG